MEIFFPRIAADSWLQDVLVGNHVCAMSWSSGVTIPYHATEGCVGLHNHLYDYATPIPTRWAPFGHPNNSRGHGMRTSKAAQTSENWVNVLIFARLIFTPLHVLEIRINHIGFNVGL